MSVCYLVGAGDFQRSFTRSASDIIIAADGGYDSLLKFGITPDVLIGDFDSINADIPTDIDTVKLPKEKDETDMFLAYLEGVKRGYSEFVMLGATGGRLDHTFANLSLLLYARERGHRVRIVDGQSEIICIKNEAVELKGNVGDTLSVFAFGTQSLGVCIKGAKYEVEGATLSPSFPLGVSNEFLEGAARISVDDGALLIISEYSSDAIDNG